jgi:hypothetical protein
MDHAGWMERSMSYLRRKPRKSDKPMPEKLSEFQAKVINIIGIVGGGIYNAPICRPERIDWDYGWRGVSVQWKRELATFDGNQLTILLFLCHEARIRLEIEAGGPGMLRLSFWQRVADGRMGKRHPNLDEAVADFRTWFTAEHSINYRAEPATTAPAEGVAA